MPYNPVTGKWITPYMGPPRPPPETPSKLTKDQERELARKKLSSGKPTAKPAATAYDKYNGGISKPS
ncbi:MAG: hypothetical protein ACRC1D_05970 [Culicoidibacterales bacterium]